jgi:hypothetical protein
MALLAGAGRGLLFPSGGDGALGALEAIRAVGFAQIDTISVLRRAHDHVLWSRAPRWDPSFMTGLETAPRRVFEYWAHAASYLPIEDWRFQLPRMRRIAREGHEWRGHDQAIVDEALARIRSCGPLSSRHFSSGGAGERGWWNWKPAKVALEYLFHAGVLVCVTREGFEKIYDLAERHIDADTLAAPVPDDEEMAAWYVDRAAASLGVFVEGEVAYQRRDGKAKIREELARRLEEGALVRVSVAGMEGYAAYADQCALDSSAAVSMPARPTLRLLSPFDPLIIQRKRAARLFGLEYSLECYVPEPQRTFGYFATPLLYASGGDARFVGLMDALMDRRASTLSIRRLRFGAPKGREARFEAIAAFAEELEAFAAFNGAERVSYELVESDDGNFARSLRSRVASCAPIPPGRSAE